MTVGCHSRAVPDRSSTVQAHTRKAEIKEFSGFVFDAGHEVRLLVAACSLAHL